MSRVLGLDPGFACIGYAVVELDPTPSRVLSLGVIRTKKSGRKLHVLASADNFRRARELGRELSEIALDARVDAVCAEAMSFPRSSSVAAKMAMCWGVLAQLCQTLALPVVQASPQDIKRAVAGRASASKDDVAAALSTWFPDAIGLVKDMPAGLHEHAFDALGAVIACMDSDVIRALNRPQQKESHAP